MVKISADSTCDLSSALLQKYAVSIAPLYILKDDVSFRDGLEISPEDIFAHVDATGRLCKTSAVSVADYIDLFGRLTADGSEVVHINISAEFSACYQNAVIAAREFQNVYPVDSRNLSTGSGHLVIEAALRAQSGMSAREIQREITAMTGRVDASFVIERLDYLYKGGRCSALAALGANLLHLKPCIEVRDGKMCVGRKYRGSFEKALCEYVADRLRGRKDLVFSRVFITHPACARETVELVRKTIEKYAQFDEIIETRAGCTVSNHCGPHTLGILFLREAQSAK